MDTRSVAMYLKIDQPVTRIGLISDTHGILRPEALAHFKDVDCILHAGDIGKPAILRELEKIAPTVAVLGNTDIPSWFPELKKTAMVDCGNKRVYLIHDVEELDIDPASADVHVVIHGHTHKYSAHEKYTIRYFNPGSAGYPRFLIPLSVAILTISDSFQIDRHIIKIPRD